MCGHSRRLKVTAETAVVTSDSYMSQQTAEFTADSCGHSRQLKVATDSSRSKQTAEITADS
jgi:hypothetical protein